VWIVAALFALPSGLSEDLCLELECARAIYPKNVTMFELLVSCVLPLCVIAFSYIMTARHLVKSAQPLSEEKQNPQLNTRTNAAKIVVGLTVVFLLSSVPYHTFWTINVFNIQGDFYGDFYYDIDEHNWRIHVVSMCFFLLNPCLNPVALFCTSLAFRRQFKRYLTCCFKLKSPVINIVLVRRK
jgi:uncharacterized membrane protein (UPF0182 family)